MRVGRYLDLLTDLACVGIEVSGAAMRDGTGVAVSKLGYGDSVPGMESTGAGVKTAGAGTNG